MAGAKPLYGQYQKEHGMRGAFLFEENGQATPYQFAIEDEKERFWVQGEKLTRPKYTHALPIRTVYISPFDMNMLYFAPDVRRQYMDDIVTRAFSGFAGVKKDYEQTVRQRNRLLKHIKEGSARPGELDFWDNKVAELAEQYALYRRRYIDFVSENQSRYPEFFGAYQVRLQYQGDWFFAENIPEYIRTYLHENRERDILTGHTHIGPHRDDFALIMPDGQSVAFYLSRGEMKMLLLGLKLLEADLLQHYTQKDIVILVDDIFAELDDTNALQFLNKTIHHQMILTSQKPLPEGIKPENFSCINITLP